MKNRSKGQENKEINPWLQPWYPYPRHHGKSSLERAQSSTTTPRTWPASEEPSGLAHYNALYDPLRPWLDDVRTFADFSIEVYEYEQAKKKQ